MRGGQDVIVVGAGVAGLSAALALADAGARVTLMEAGGPLSGASGAAAGMLSPVYEALTLPAGAHPGLPSLWADAFAAWPAFAARLSVSFTAHGTLALAAAATPDWTAPLSAPPPGVLDGLAAPAGAAWIAQEAAVDPAAAGAALVAAARAAGVVVEADAGAVRPWIDGGRVVGVLRAGDRRPAGAVVLAAGHGARAWADVAPELSALTPVRGQLLAVAAVRALAFTVRRGPLYVTPRGRRWVVGATADAGDADASCRPADAARLLAGLAAIVPDAARSLPLASWAGVRPGSPDHAPLLGPSSRAGLHLACGAHRNGWLLAPAIGRLAAAGVATGAAPAEAAPFTPLRFGDAR